MTASRNIKLLTNQQQGNMFGQSRLGTVKARSGLQKITTNSCHTVFGLTLKEKHFNHI